MKSRRWLVLVLGLATAWPVLLRADAPSSSTATSADDALRVIILGSSRPVRLRLVVNINGQPFRDTWREHFARLFEARDKDGDARVTVDQARAIAELMSGGTLSQGPDLAAIDALAEESSSAESGDKTVARDKLLVKIEQAAPPLVIAATFAGSRYAGPALFPLLDANADGQLSAEELNNVEPRLYARDFDDNQLIGYPELIVDPNLPLGPQGDDTTAAGVVTPVEPSGEAKAVDSLLARYDRNQDQHLSLGPLDELQFESEVAEELDLNKDQRLDREELMRFIAGGHDVELNFDLGKPGRSSRRTTSRPQAGFRVRPKIDGGYRMRLLDTEVDFRRNNRDPSQSQQERLTLADLDADGNEYLDEKEIMNNPITARAFKSIDRDGDEKITSQELNSFVRQRRGVEAVRLRLEVADQGQDLFALLDSNNDGLLSPREQREADAVLKVCDANRDGRLNGNEVPRQITLELSRGANPQQQPMRNAVRRVTATPTTARSEAGPTWFRKMDRNGDGELTPREFLGTRETFDKLDADRDELLSHTEAEAAK